MTSKMNFMCKTGQEPLKVRHQHHDIYERSLWPSTRNSLFSRKHYVCPQSLMFVYRLHTSTFALWTEVNQHPWLLFVFSNLKSPSTNLHFESIFADYTMLDQARCDFSRRFCSLQMISNLYVLDIPCWHFYNMYLIMLKLHYMYMSGLVCQELEAYRGEICPAHCFNICKCEIHCMILRRPQYSAHVCGDRTVS